MQTGKKRLQRDGDSVILHFDYDCFYASVFENENPAWRTLPLAVQQKQIVVTCNYEARRRGLHKLQLIKDAKRICPDAVIVIGEDLTRFRDASKELYVFLRSFSWNAKVERLGFDEVFMDVSDIVDYNVALLNPNDLSNSFFYLSKNDPTIGFAFDASIVAGNTFPDALQHSSVIAPPLPLEPLRLRLLLGSHLARHLREALHSQKGYTCTAGISTNKELSKLVGNLHKPHNQTTLLPPYYGDDDRKGNVTLFLDDHEVGKIPGIGFKIAQKLRAFVQERQTRNDQANENSEEKVLVGDVRKLPAISAEALEQALGGPGIPHGIGKRIWDLLNGRDDTEVGQARDVPRQISIEDSYGRLDTVEVAWKELQKLAVSLVKRMHADLTSISEEDENPTYQAAETATEDLSNRRWLAFPKTIRLSTCPRGPLNTDGSRNRSAARISRSAPLPNFIFSLKDSVPSLAARLVTDVLIPLFRKLHPEKNWNLAIMNVAATNIVDAASEKGGPGRDIAKMFRRQDTVLKQWKIEEDPKIDNTEESESLVSMSEDQKIIDTDKSDSTISMSKDQDIVGRSGSEDLPTRSQEEPSGPGEWESGDEDMTDDGLFRCEQCGAIMPVFAAAAHDRWHAET